MRHGWNRVSALCRYCCGGYCCCGGWSGAESGPGSRDVATDRDGLPDAVGAVLRLEKLAGHPAQLAEDCSVRGSEREALPRREDREHKDHLWVGAEVQAVQSCRATRRRKRCKQYKRRKGAGGTVEAQHG